MTDPQFPGGVSADHIKRFSDRAKRHMHVSYGIMALIFVLFATCGYIFFQAQDIDKTKSSVELFQELIIASQSQNEIIKALEAELAGTKEEARVSQRTTLDVLNVIAPLGDAKTKLRLLAEKERLALESGYSSDIDTSNSKEELSAVGAGIAEYQKTLSEMLDDTNERFKVGEVTRTDVHEVERFISEATSKQKLNEQKAKLAPAAMQIKKAGANIDTLSLIGTSLIRFGGVAVTLFLMAVLVPIYRYNVRLSSYYLAMADALTLCKDVAVPNFKELTALLTPSILFDKEPNTPVDAVSSIVKDTASLAKKI